jgi:hypothetical protein
MALRCRKVGAVHSIIFDRFNMALRCPVIRKRTSEPLAFMSTRPNRKRRRERAAGRINQNHQITLCAGDATILLLGCISHAVAASPSPVTPAPQP